MSNRLHAEAAVAEVRLSSYVGLSFALVCLLSSRAHTNNAFQYVLISTIKTY